MRRFDPHITACLALTLLTSFLPAGAQTPPIVGRWDMTIHAPRPYPSWFEVTEKDGRLAGRFVGAFGHATPLKKVEFANGHVSLWLGRRVETERNEPSFTGTLKDDKITLTPAVTKEPPETAQTAKGSKMDRLLVYVGTYTSKQSKGIYLFEMDGATGALTPRGVVAETTNPSFLALHPNGRFLYAVNEISNFEGTQSGAVSAFAIDTQTGRLTLLNQQSSRGSGPCHLVVDRAGKNILVANYGGGSVAALPLQENGRLGPATAFIQHEGKSVNPHRQEGPHAHAIHASPDNRFALAMDLGLDKILVYRLDAAKGTLAPNDPPAAPVAPGAGPRHFAFHPNGRFAYVINELNSTVTAFQYDARRGILKEIQTLPTLPEGLHVANWTAEVQVHPSGKFLYGSNRGHDSLVIYAIDPETGLLRYVGNQPTQGKTPRNFGIDPTGTYLLAANEQTDTIVVFRIDPQTGELKPTGHVVETPTPVCVRFLPVAP